MSTTPPQTRKTTLAHRGQRPALPSVSRPWGIPVPPPLAAILKEAAKVEKLRPRALVALTDWLNVRGQPDACIQDAPLLSVCAAAGWMDAVRVLLDLAAAVNGIDGHVPLILAALNGHILVVNALIAAGADIGINEDQALRLAAAHGQTAVVVALIAAGANVNARHGGALTAAASLGHQATIDALLAAGANPGSQDHAALLMAVINDHTAAVTVLLDAGGIPVGRQDILAIAATHGHKTIVAAFLAAGADVHNDNDAALHRSLHNGHRDAAMLLFAAGADSVAAWRRAAPSQRAALARTLNAIAMDIPEDQSDWLLAAAPSAFPALRARKQAQERQYQRRRRQPTVEPVGSIQGEEGKAHSTRS